MTIAKSALNPMASTSEAMLLPLLGSVTPVGGEMVTELLIEPVAVDSTVAVNWKVAVPPDNKLTVVLMLPLPVATAQLDPLDAVQVQVAPVS